MYFWSMLFIANPNWTKWPIFYQSEKFGDFLDFFMFPSYCFETYFKRNCKFLKKTNNFQTLIKKYANYYIFLPFYLLLKCPISATKFNAVWAALFIENKAVIDVRGDTHMTSTLKGVGGVKQKWDVIGRRGVGG